MIVISGVDRIDSELYDKIWYITNNTPNMKIGAEHHAELAPDPTQYYMYRNGQISVEQLLNMYGNDLWTGKYNCAIAELIKLSDDGNWIQLVCYCHDAMKCHRYVLYRYLRAIGADVQILDDLEET